LTLIGLIFVSKYFQVLCEANFGAWMLIIKSRDSCHVISISLLHLLHVNQHVHVITLHHFLS